MTVNGIDGRRRGKWEEREETARKYRIQSGCGERVGRRETGRRNLSCETKFSCANVNFPCSADHEQTGNHTGRYLVCSPLLHLGYIPLK